MICEENWQLPSQLLAIGLVPNQCLTKMICTFYSKIMFVYRGAKGDVYEGGTRGPGLLYHKR